MTAAVSYTARIALSTLAMLMWAYASAAAASLSEPGATLHEHADLPGALTTGGLVLLPHDPQYVNRGSDPRILEKIPIIGWLSKWLQHALSFHSTTEPHILGFTFGEPPSLGHLAVQWPPFFTVAVPKANGRYWTFRIGWRWDHNWLGYIADVIVKTDMKTPVTPILR